MLSRAIKNRKKMKGFHTPSNALGQAPLSDSLLVFSSSQADRKEKVGKTQTGFDQAMEDIDQDLNLSSLLICEMEQTLFSAESFQ